MNPNPRHPSSAGPDLKPKSNMADSEGALDPLSEVCGQATLDSLQDLGKSGHHPTWDFNFSLSTHNLSGLSPQPLPVYASHYTPPTIPRPQTHPSQGQPPHIPPSYTQYLPRQRGSIIKDFQRSYNPLAKSVYVRKHTQATENIP